MSGPAHNILGSLPVPKLVWTMSAPIMLSMLMSAIYNLVDSIYVAQVSELDFLALSYAYPVQLMMVAFCAGTGVGFNALFAQRLGAGQKEEANRVACHGFLFYGLCWLLFLAFALLGAPLFFRLSTDNAAVAAAGTSYLVICCGLSIGMCMQFLTERLLQTTGHPAGFMIVQGSGAILNIILDPVFIFGLDMGLPRPPSSARSPGPASAFSCCGASGGSFLSPSGASGRTVLSLRSCSASQPPPW